MEEVNKDIRRKDEPESEKGKDWLPFSSMLRLIEQFDGLRLYRL